MPTGSPERSPYEAVLGDELEALHPRLRAYFGAIPSGSIGVGEGLFTVVGAQKWWVRALITLVAPRDVLFPVWERSVPFSVVNAPEQRDGLPAVSASRTFHFPGGDRTMIDLIAQSPLGTQHQLVDQLGVARRFEASFSARVVDGALTLESTVVSVRVGRRALKIPFWISPRVSLSERFDDALQKQRVELVMTHPAIGRVYEYAGTFSYQVRARENVGGEHR